MTTTRPRGFTLVELLVVIAVIAVLTTLCLPVIQHSRDAARRTQCQNNLKQFGLALHNYFNVHKTLPPGWTQHHPLPGPQPRFGWAVFVLPFLDQAPLYRQLNFQTQKAEPLELFQTPLAVSRCPSDGTPVTNGLRGEFGTMNYSANFGSVAPPRWLAAGLDESWPGASPTLEKTDGVMFLNSRIRFADIIDGTSQTLMAGERSAAGAAAIWMGVRGNEFETDQVTDCSPGHEINSGSGGFSSRHAGGASFLFVDGRVVFLSEKIESGPVEGRKMRTYQMLSHRSDGLAIGEF